MQNAFFFYLHMPSALLYCYKIAIKRYFQLDSHTCKKKKEKKQ